MKTFIGRFVVVAALVLGVVAFSAGQAKAQLPIRYIPSAQQMINPNPFIAPGLTLGQWAYNQRVIANVYNSYPPWYYGYNPYPQVINYGPVYRPPVVLPTYVNPYLNPYLNPYVNLYTNPYATYVNPYFP